MPALDRGQHRGRCGAVLDAVPHREPGAVAHRLAAAPRGAMGVLIPARRGPAPRAERSRGGDSVTKKGVLRTPRAVAAGRAETVPVLEYPQVLGPVPRARAVT